MNCLSVHSCDGAPSLMPQMEWTDRHYRFMIRGITRYTQLYTEMVVDGTVRVRCGMTQYSIFGWSAAHHHLRDLITHPPPFPISISTHVDMTAAAPAS